MTKAFSSDDDVILSFVGAQANGRQLPAVSHSAAGADLVGVGPRTAAEDYRIAVHEACHCLAARCVGAEIGGVTITATQNFGGLVWGPGNVASKFDPSGVADLCTRLVPLMPPIGESRGDIAEMQVHAVARAVELVAASEGEAMLLPDGPPLRAISSKPKASPRYFAFRPPPLLRF